MSNFSTTLRSICSSSSFDMLSWIVFIRDWFIIYPLQAFLGLSVEEFAERLGSLILYPRQINTFTFLMLIYWDDEGQFNTKYKPKVAHTMFLSFSLSLVKPNQMISFVLSVIYQVKVFDMISIACIVSFNLVSSTHLGIMRSIIRYCEHQDFVS